MEKGVQDHKQEILNIIRSNVSPAAMTSRLEDFHENDLADVLPAVVVIVLIVLLNAVLGVIQESRAEAALPNVSLAPSAGAYP